MTEAWGISAKTAPAANTRGGDPLLAELTDSPGYFPLLDGSPAVDAADMAHCLETDQTGKARPIGGGCDIGAFESEARGAGCSNADAGRLHIVRSHPFGPIAIRRLALARPEQATTLSASARTSHLMRRCRRSTGRSPSRAMDSRISGNHQFRIFSIVGRTLTIKDLTLADGYSAEDGGAILVENGAGARRRKCCL